MRRRLLGRGRSGGGIPVENLIAGYKYENNLLDSVGSANATGSNITYAPGKVGQAAVFNGANSLAQISAPVFNFQENGIDKPFSICFWIYKKDTNTVGLVEKYIDTVLGEWHIRTITGNRVLFQLQFNATTYLRISMVDEFLTVNQWHHIACTYDGGGAAGILKMYLDAVPISSESVKEGGYTAKRVREATPVVIGRYGNGNYGYANMEMDSLYPFNKELSPSEVSAIVNKQDSGIEII